MPICTKCGSQIDFHRGPNGKRVPVDADGTLHFILCASLQLEREGIHLNATDYTKARQREAERLAGKLLALAGRPPAREPDDDAIQQNIRKVPCPDCAAKAGDRCVRKTGKERSKYHAARRTAARIALLPAPLAARAVPPTGAAQ